MYYAQNKTASFDYELQETIEAGLVLTGGETKSIRTGAARLTGSYITIHNGEAWLIGSHVPRYRFQAPSINHETERSRKLLLSKKQINYLRGKKHELGLTIIPLNLYPKGAKIKLALALAKSKKKHDKREALKKRDIKKEIARTLKHGDDRLR